MMIRTQKFGSGATILRDRSGAPLSLDVIAERAPSVLAEQAHDSRSERYTYIPTRQVLAGLMAEGFQPFEVRQGGSRDAEKRAHTKHMIRLRHVSHDLVEVAPGDRIAPEIIVLNSHDGTSSYQLTAGAFRMVCTNGLIAGDAFEHVRVPHRGDVMGDVIDAAFRVVGEFPRLVDGAREMAALQLAGPERLAFATAAAQLRWTPEDDQPSSPPIPVERLLDVRRVEDRPADLWRTLNVVQEGLLGGGQAYVQRDERGRRVARRRVREVNGIDQNRHLNRALWTLAEEMRKLKA